MGIRSEVVICMKECVHRHMSPEARKFLKEWHFEERERVKTGEDAGRLFCTSDVKWYSDSYEDIIAFMRHLHEDHDEDDWLLIKACPEYPNDDTSDAGGWYENPWNLYKRVSVDLDWDYAEVQL